MSDETEIVTDLSRIVVALSRGYSPEDIQPEVERVVAAFDEENARAMPLRTYFGHGDAAEAFERFLRNRLLTHE